MKMNMSKYKALFVHIPKTGGASMQKAPWILNHGSYNFSPEVPMRDIPGLKVSFAFVRHPLTRFTSAVFNHGYCEPDQQAFSTWFYQGFLPGYQARFMDWPYLNQRSWVELQPQWRYVFYEGKQAVDFVGRFEEIEKGWQQVCKMAGEDFELPWVNKNKVRDHKKFITPDIEKQLREVYAEDFKRFEYS